MIYRFFAWRTALAVLQPEDVNVTTMVRFAATVLDLRSAEVLG